MYPILQMHYHSNKIKQLFALTISRSNKRNGQYIKVIHTSNNEDTKRFVSTIHTSQLHSKNKRVQEMHVFMSGPLHLVTRELSLIYTFMFVRPPRKRDRQPADDSQFIFVTRQYLNRDFYLTVSNTRARVLRQYVVHQWRNNSLNVRRLLFAYYARTEEERASIG